MMKPYRTVMPDGGFPKKQRMFLGKRPCPPTPGAVVSARGVKQAMEEKKVCCRKRGPLPQH